MTETSEHGESPLMVALDDGLQHLSIDADIDDRACYALSVNRRPPIRSITLRNMDGFFTGPLTVTVESEWTASDRPPIRRITQAIDSPALGDAVEVDFSSSRLDDLALAFLDDVAPATVHVVVRDAEGHEQRRIFEIMVLARNQWRHDLFEITAAFVQPDHPAVPGILADAAQRLKQRTGYGSLAGDQVGPEGVLSLAEAIYDALGTRITTYLTSPPTEYEFDREGQRVRPLDQLLESGQGNCIELACAFASCAYAAGIRPVIFLLHGHAFGGFYLSVTGDGRMWNKALTTEIGSIQMVLAQGNVVPLETTSIPSARPFSTALTEIRDEFVSRQPGCSSCKWAMASGLSEDERPHMEAVLDVGRARAEGVLSLPIRTISDGMEVLIIDQGGSNPPLIERRDPVTRRLVQNSVPVRVQKWKTALLDLSRRNTLISFNAIDRGLQLLCVPTQVGEIEDHLVDGGTVVIKGDDDISEVLAAAGITSWSKANEDDLRRIWNTARVVPASVRKLKRKRSKGVDGQGKEVGEPEVVEEPITVSERARDLARRQRAAEADTGVNNLYLCLGMVTWPFDGVNAPNSKVTSPVFLVPIRMNVPRGDRAPSITLAPDSMTTPNYTLIESLRRKFGLKLAWFDEDMSDDSGLDIMRGLDELRKELVSAGLADSGLRVESHAAIGMFPFQNVRLWKDLTDHWEEFLGNPVVKHLVEVGTGVFQDPADSEGDGVPEYGDLTLLNPQPADGAQTRAIVRALSGQSFVLEGPPGTGKSQTITNLLANALARGMKVLFVAEKPDARKVVQERLIEVGLDPFCLDLHDQGSGPEKIKEQLRDALDFRPTDVEEKWSSLDDRYRAVTSILAGYRERIHGATSSGKSYFDSYETLLEMGGGPIASIGRALAEVDQVTISEIRRILLDLPSYAEAAQVRDGHPWAFVGVRDLDGIDRQSLADLVQRISLGFMRLKGAPGPWADALARSRSIEEAATVISCARIVQFGSIPTAADRRAISRSDWQESTERALNGIANGLEVAGALGVDSSVLARDLRAQLTAVNAAAASFVIGRKGKLAAALSDLAMIPAFLGLNRSTVVPAFTQLADASDAYRGGIERLKRCEGMDLRLLHDPLDASSIVLMRERTADLYATAAAEDSGSELGAALRDCLEADIDFAKLDEAQACLGEVARLMELLGSTPLLQASWIANRSLIDALDQSLATWDAGRDGTAFMTLRRWLDLVSHLSVLEPEPFTEFRQELLEDRIPAEEAVEAFDRAHIAAVLKVVGEASNFDVFDQSRQDRSVRRFVELTSERQALLRDLIPARLFGARRFNATSTAGSVGGLRTELATKKRGARSIRSLISKYPGLISELTPCFLMGPDSVAKFIPPGSINFDLVVFDEASQIRVEEAIGAMGRAQGTVIVGDSRQMPPSSAFTSRAGLGEEDELSLEDFDAPIEEAESILEEAVEAGLPRELLAWHYRSRDEVLINFSNEKYYEGRLGSFPSPFLSRSGVGITYQRVDGQFLHSSKDVSGRTDANLDESAGGPIQTNPIEADAIVKEIQRRAHDPIESQYSMGVVTLNKGQAELIKKKLEKLKDPVIDDLMKDPLPSQSLLVLNLESVQGRERDVIILGTSFSNRAGTERMPLQFGPLTAKGGERRLNVAITRARRQVVIFSSFDPMQLKSARSLGMQHLSEYLGLAQRASEDRDSLDQMRPPKHDPYIAQVAEELRKAGLEARVGYGLSHFKVDIAVGSAKVPGQWLVGVLLDGREWASRSMVLDRDGLPVTVLTRMMDWPAVARVWLPAWQRDPQEVIQGIVELVELVASAGESVALPAAMNASEVQDDDPLDFGSIDDTVVVPSSSIPSTSTVMPAFPVSSAVIEVRRYQPLVLEGRAGSPADLEESGAVIRSLLTSLADRDGPVEATVALKAVARVFGLDRVRQARIDAITSFLPRANVIQTTFGTFLFPEELLDGPGRVSARFNWYRTSSFSERPFDQIAPHEVANAAVRHVIEAYEIDRVELATTLLTTFGYVRKSADAVAGMLSRVDWAVREGYLQSAGNTLTGACLPGQRD